MTKIKFENSPGQTIIEVLAALTAATIVVAAMTIAVITALNNAQYSKNQNLATQYAQEGMEFIRNLRSSNPVSFTAYNGHYCLDGYKTLSGPTLTCNSNLGPNNIFLRELDFVRTINCDPNGTDPQIKVTMYVRWSDSKCQSSTNTFCNNATLVSCFPDIRLIPTP